MTFAETSQVVHPFLLDLLRGSDPEALLPRAPQARDWETIVRDAETHGFTPFLHRRLKRSYLDRPLPAGLASRLEGHAFGLAARNMVLADELGTILGAFEARDLSCAPLRGLALAERLYGDITARPMGDIDLLVRKEDLDGAGRVLRDLGFSEMDRRPGFARAYSYTLKFFKERLGWVVIEPHWTIAYPPFVDRIEMDAVWKRCGRGRVVGVETWLLGREDLLFHLCLHLMHRDRTAPFLWFYELDRLLRRERETLDWSQVLALARGAKLEVFLSEALDRVRALFATPIPERVLSALRAGAPRSVDGRLVRLLAGASGVDGKESLAVFFTLKGFGAKLRYAGALLFPSPEFMRIQYGLARRSQLGPVYVRRVCCFAWEGVKGVMKLFV